MNRHSCSYLISVLLLTQCMGKVTLSPRTEWVFTVWKDRYGASLFYLLRTVIIYKLCYFILKNSSQNKEVARENFCKETRN